MKKFGINFLEKGGKFYSEILPQKRMTTTCQLLVKNKARFITATCLENSAGEIFFYYHFEIAKRIFTFKTKIENLKAESISKFYPNSSWIEREVWEFYKIEFKNQIKKPLLWSN